MSDFDFLQSDDPAPPPAPALRDVRVKPGARVPQVDPATERLVLGAGGCYHLSGLKGTAVNLLEVSADGVLTGGRGKWRKSAEGCGVLLDECQAVLLSGLRVTDCLHGIRMRTCNIVAVEAVETWANEIEGAIAGGCTGCVWRDIHTHHNGTVGAHAGDRAHGAYESYQGRGNIWLRLNSHDNRGAGFHCNSPTDESGVGPMRDITLRDSIIKGNGTSGTGNADAMNTRGLTIANCLIVEGNGGLSTWDDGSGNPKNGAKGVVVSRSTIVNPKWALRLESGGEVRFERSVVAGPFSVDRTSSITWDETDLRGSVSESAAWLNPDYSSRVAGVGWGG